MRCGKKPYKKISGHSRCPANTAGRRKTKAERRAKVWKRGAKKLHVDSHKRHVCMAKK
jgi:hypothetical protein